ncbi:retrotransposon protein, putative, unclassified [Cucumis melo var. makuwa]|uniref:Retrotransposon protein, putative, unclassified n=1 Tax=Cucumis melo var. makuwa TaxID=1194695 RepID=A0A5A7SIC7_CUCMM|nr:retrotransposon protein, putative, unclassified [Cucumis melo var. makuwa]
MDGTFLENDPFFTASLLQGESKCEDSNSSWVISVESTSPPLVTIANVKNAFFSGDLEEEVYMSPPSGFKAQFSHQFLGSLFTKFSKARKVEVLTIYVNDIVLFGDNHIEIIPLKKRMTYEFEIKDLGNLKYFLEMEVARSKEGIFVSQRKYTLNLPTETNMLGFCPTDTPTEFNCKLKNSDDKVPIDKEQYQCLVERQTGKLSKLILIQTGQHLLLIENLPLVIVPLYENCKMPMKLFCDNMESIDIDNNPFQHDGTKHVEIDRHFIKERLDNGSICISYIPSSQQVVDVPAKRFLRQNFDFCVSKLGHIDIYVPT